MTFTTVDTTHDRIITIKRDASGMVIATYGPTLRVIASSWSYSATLSRAQLMAEHLGCVVVEVTQ